MNKKFATTLLLALTLTALAIAGLTSMPRMIVSVTTDAPTYTADLQIGDLLANKIPGSWETKGEIKWACVNPAVVVKPIFNGVNCEITPPAPGEYTVTVTADISRDGGATYTPLEGRTDIKFIAPPGPATPPAQLLIIPSAANTATVLQGKKAVQ